MGFAGCDTRLLHTVSHFTGGDPTAATETGLTNLTNHGDDGIVVAMGKLMNLYEAKTQLSALVDEAANGAEIIIAKAGKPLAKLVAFRETARRKPGRAKAVVWIGDDFDAPLPAELHAAFNGDRD